MSVRLIDLHSHILPGIDDGAPDLATSLEMARAWVADGVSILACTPHILPGLYHNTGPQIREAVAHLQEELDERGIPLQLVTGADNHVTPNFAPALKNGLLLTLADTRYVLVEPPHHTAPPRLSDLFFSIMAAGYQPILTHPERLTWIKPHYELIRQLARRGVWMQITAGSLTGAFGRSPKYWGERMLAEGLVHILATDAHDMTRRPPILSEGYESALKIVGKEEAWRLVHTRPLAILENRPASDIVLPEPLQDKSSKGHSSHATSSRPEKVPPSSGGGGEHAARGIAGWVQQLFS
jgi:protein-tyrosine phosphatase